MNPGKKATKKGHKKSHKETASESKKNTKKGKRAGKNPKISCFSGLSVQYHDNLFGLSKEQIEKFNEMDAGDIASSRFKDIDSISDYVMIPSLGARFVWKRSPLGKVSLISGLKYNFTEKNQRGRYPEGQIRLRKSNGKRDRLLLDAEITLRKFRKNYLYGVDDWNMNKNVTRKERLYSAAVFDEHEARLGYEHTFLKGEHRRFSGFSAQPFLGIRKRKYNSAFSNRDFQLHFGGIQLGLGFFSRLDLNVRGQIESLKSPSGNEVFLYDETIPRIDINGDGKIKKNAACIGVIDRSAKRKAIEIESEYRFSKRFSIHAGVKHRTEDYSSSNPLDTGHFERNGYMRQVKTGFSIALSRNITGKIQFIKHDEVSGDDDQYAEKRYQASLEFDLD